MSFNQVILIGNVGKDPEFRAMTSGARVCSFSLATSERWKDKRTGERKEHTDWHNVVVFNENIQNVIEQYVEKGSKIMVQGQVKTRKWEKDGETRYTTEIVLQNFNSQLVLLGSKGDGGGRADGSRYDGYDRGGGGGGGFSGQSQDHRGNPREDFSADLDDEIPFATMYSIR